MKTQHKIAALVVLASLIFVVGRAQKNEQTTESAQPTAPGVRQESTETAQQPAPYTIRVGVGLTVLPVTVTDKSGHRVSGLTKDNFQVSEDGVPQQVTVFEGQDTPVTVGMVVDNSLSMQPSRPAVVSAALVFADISNPQDQIFVVTFNKTVHLELPENVPFTKDTQELKNALLKLQPRGETALYDALIVALDHLKSGTGERKYLIVVSDGGDNASHHTLSDVVDSAKASEAAVYSVAIINENYSDENPEALKKLSKLTGGEFFQPENVDDVVQVTKTIARDIRQQYTLGYIPTNQNANGQFRKVRVIATAPYEGKLRVHTREGYVVPVENAPESASTAGAGR